LVCDLTRLVTALPVLSIIATTALPVVSMVATTAVATMAAAATVLEGDDAVIVVEGVEGEEWR
jgi:hypothetical protein